MKKNIILLFNSFKQYFFITLGFIYILLYIYFNFIRERLPKDIPFILTEYRFYSLCIICLIYFYIVYRNFYPKMPSIIAVSLISLLTKPLSLFLQFLKQFRVVSQIYNRSWLHLIPILDDCSLRKNVKLIYFLAIIPRIILLSLFILDIFYFRYIFIFYYFIFLGLFPLLYVLFIKYLEYILEECIQFLEEYYPAVRMFEVYDDEPNPDAIYDNELVSVRKYININLEFYSKNNFIEYELAPVSTQIRILKHEKNLKKKTIDMTIEELNILDHEFNFVMPKILVIKIFLDINTKNANKKYYTQEIKIFILVMYLISWLYILFVSLHTLNHMEYTIRLLELLTKYSNIWEPFSNLPLLI